MGRKEGRRRWMGGGFAMTTLGQEDGWADIKLLEGQTLYMREIRNANTCNLFVIRMWNCMHPLMHCDYEKASRHND